MITIGYGQRPTAELYAEVLELAKRAEALGLAAVWTTEHHFVDNDYFPSPLVVSAAIAAVTDRIRIGTGVVLAPLHHPLRLIEDATTVDILSRGRLILGLGLGWSPIEFDAFGASPRTRGRAMEELLDIVDGAVAGTPLVHHGQIYDLPPVNVRPKPYRGRLDTWIGASAEPALRRAARRACGVLLHGPIYTFRDQVVIVQDELEKIGRDPASFEFGVYLTILPVDRNVDGWTRYGELVLYHDWKYLDMAASAGRADGPLPRLGSLPESEQEWIRDATLVGAAEDIAEQLDLFRHAAGGVLHVVADSYLPGLPAEERFEILERIATEVGPRVAAVDASATGVDASCPGRLAALPPAATP
jgi:alkanesulfonate monooxygenase SsuD/methylene tetrahydromethanopterin reductase-like flavin-dependent oxidoreductase (luciferase family)